MQAGKLRHQIQFQVYADGRDPESGDPMKVWQDWPAPGKKIWGSIEALSARDFIAAQAAQSEVTARIVIRSRPGVLPTMRAVHRGLVYTIHGVLPDAKGGKDYLTLPVSEGVKDG